jgi:aminoglycoside 6'-N-acetyltransferase I
LTASQLHIAPLGAAQAIPFALLELADPSRSQIDSYLKTGTCHIATLGTQIVGVVVLDKVDASTAEIKNIAVQRSEQGKGFGKRLLGYAGQLSRKEGYKRLIIGTGNSSIRQLALYQKEGFEMRCIERDYFLKNYDQPIVENGIQCKHRVVLEKILSPD